VAAIWYCSSSFSALRPLRALRALFFFFFFGLFVFCGLGPQSEPLMGGLVLSCALVFLLGVLDPLDPGDRRLLFLTFTPCKVRPCVRSRSSCGILDEEATEYAVEADERTEYAVEETEYPLVTEPATEESPSE
jgi:hypothetical protein